MSSNVTLNHTTNVTKCFISTFSTTYGHRTEENATIPQNVAFCLLNLRDLQENASSAQRRVQRFEMQRTEPDSTQIQERPETQKSKQAIDNKQLKTMRKLPAEGHNVPWFWKKARSTPPRRSFGTAVESV